MNKKSKILIIGFGSIGQRHYKNLKKLGYKNLYVFDTNKKVISNSKFQIPNFNADTLKEFKIVFICTPNNLHIKHTLAAARAGCHLFIEKPLSHNLKDIDKLKKIIKAKKLINLIACNLRFHPCLQFVKRYLDSKKIGQVYAIHHEFGYYLPYWRSGIDYTKNYAAKKSTGGGIILDDIHEFDLLFWLNNFKPVKQSKFIYNKISNLKIETEDCCVASFKFSNIIASVRCDYLQQQESRHCKIIGEQGNLEIDLLKNTVYLNNKQGSKNIFALKRKDDNDDYLGQLKYFLNCVNNKKQTFNDISTAQKTLEYIFNR